MPQLKVDLSAIRRNAEVFCDLCGSRGIAVSGVIKGAAGALPVAKAVAAGGCRQLASSRLSQLRAIKAALPEIETLLIRMPLPTEAEAVVSCCDMSLNTEADTLRALSEAALRAGRIHKVILMLELGDLREGILGRETLMKLAKVAEDLPGLHLAGIGSTLNDIYGVSPSRENMGELAEAFHDVENAIGRKLDILSGGSTTALPMLLKGELPAEINHLRIGEAILTGRDLPDLWGTQVPGCHCDTLTLEARIIEVNRKPTRPWGVRSQNGFGEQPPLPPDRGQRRRAILDVGRCDVGDVSQLICPEGVTVIGASSDHLVVDIQERPDLRMGDVLRVRLFYQGMLFAFQSADVEKVYVE